MHFFIRKTQISDAFNDINEIKQTIDELGKLNVKKNVNLLYSYRDFLIYTYIK